MKSVWIVTIHDDVFGSHRVAVTATLDRAKEIVADHHFGEDHTWTLTHRERRHAPGSPKECREIWSTDTIQCMHYVAQQVDLIE